MDMDTVRDKSMYDRPYMELDLHLRMRFGSSAEARAMADKGYIRGLATKLQDRIEENKQQVLRDNHEAELIKSEAPKHWMELKTWLKDVVALLEPFQYEEDTANEISLRCLTGRDVREVTVNFRSMTGDISAKGNISKVGFCAIVD